MLFYRYWSGRQLWCCCRLGKNIKSTRCKMKQKFRITIVNRHAVLLLDLTNSVIIQLSNTHSENYLSYNNVSCWQCLHADILRRCGLYVTYIFHCKYIVTIDCRLSLSLRSFWRVSFVFDRVFAYQWIQFCVSGTVSLLVIRKKELVNGVAVMQFELNEFVLTLLDMQIQDHLGDIHGESHAAAKQGLAKCAAARVTWTLVFHNT